MGVTTVPPSTITPPSPGSCRVPSGATICPPGRTTVPPERRTVPSVCTE